MIKSQMKKSVFRTLTVLAGVNILLGIFHLFFLSNMMGWGTELSGLAPESQATIAVLNIFMGVLFTGFGILSFIYLPLLKEKSKGAWIFFMFLGIIWFIRAIMEPIYYPVIWEEIMFTIILLVIAGLYLYPLIKHRKEFVK
mgnify:CR=1 FL=1|tara:strand:- start:2595 stop:3017 length:423 start_codon:yes stop_codon:yes gene_type:complete